MNKYLQLMSHDEGHLLPFYPRRFRTGVLAGGLACVVALCSGCSVAPPPCVLDVHGELNYPCVITAETMAQERHKDVSKTMKDFRLP